ncbi:MAG TPA: class I SAM-dependent methyltransferase [Candidatus Eisenbacteria bacterium]|nr:class I SAM-dependent methyltransferase [Candidatus Eisenbacteria bacterium]
MSDRAEFPELADQERFWETWQEAKSITPWSLARADALLALIRSLKLGNPRILDLGCGTGWFAERLSSLGTVTATDLSKKAMEEARRRRPDIRFLDGDLFTLEIPDAPFDLVVCQQVIAHVVDQPRLVERAASLLKPQGYLVITTPNRFVMDRLGDLGWDATPPEHIEQWLDRRSLERLLRPRFEILRVSSILPMGTRGILRFVNSSRLNGMLSRIIPETTIRAWKERAGLGYTLIALARRKG